MKYLLAFTVSFVWMAVGQKTTSKTADQMIRISLQQRIPSELDKEGLLLINEVQDWQAKETAIVICDMWDKHWCKGATSRVAEMAPHMNKVISIARDKGAHIVHAPSDCMDYYKNHPGRKMAKKYKVKGIEARLGNGTLACEMDEDWPFKISGGGCDDNPQCEQGSVWSKQIDSIEIEEGDIITDSGVEAIR